MPIMIQDLIDQGYLEFNKIGEHYNHTNLTNEEHGFLFSLKNDLCDFVRVGEWQGTDYYINGHRDEATDEVEDYTGYGRPCLLMDEYPYSLGGVIISEYGFQNLCAYFNLYVADENHNALRLTADYEIKFPIGQVSTNYDGEDETILSFLEYDGGTLSGSMFDSNVIRLPGWCKKVIFSTDIPIFTTIEDVQNYIEHGNIDNAINKESSEDITILDSEWYYDYKLSDIDKKNKSLINTTERKSRFKFKKRGDKGKFVYTDEDKRTAELRFNCLTVLVEVENGYAEINVESLIHDITIGEYEGKYGDIDTNLPFVWSFNDEDDLSDNKTDEIKDNFTGDSGKMDNSSIIGVTSPLGCYWCSATQFNIIKSILYTEDMTASEVLKNGLWQYGENPIDCVVDIVYIPFDISRYVATEEKKLQFGSLKLDGHIEDLPNITLTNIVGSFKKVVNVNMKIMATYNDYRDYETLKYSVYLPYYGIITLDNSVINKNLKITSFFNAWTLTLKYYVFIADSLVGSYDCEVGQHISVMGSNWIDKSKRNVTSEMNLASSTGAIVSDVIKLNVGGVISNANAITTETMNTLAKPNTMVGGGNSGGINIYDDMNFYLIIEQYETIKPTNLYSEYGIPCFMISTLNNCKGFTQISDIKLKSYATNEEQKEIIQLLNEGVII